MNKIVITGGSSGLGKEIIKTIYNMPNTKPFNIDIKPDGIQGVNYQNCDVRDLAQLIGVAEEIENADVVINCAGINHIDWMENISGEQWNDVMDINAGGIFNTTKAFLPQLIKSKGTILNIISNASHMPMTNSIAYNASKGAAHIMTLQMARELGPKEITVFGISPNKLSNTGMSDYIDSRVCDLRGWTKEYAQEYQLKNLSAGEETDTETLAEFIGFLLSTKQRHKYLAGTVLPYGK